MTRSSDRPSRAEATRAGAELTALTVLGRGLGFLFYAVAAARFGRSAETDALWLAWAAVALATTLATNALAAAYGPLFAQADLRDPRHAEDLLGWTLVGATAAAAATGLLLSVAGGPLFAATTRFDEATLADAARFLPLLAPALVFRTVFQVARSSLEMRRRFRPPAWAQVGRGGLALVLVAALPAGWGAFTLCAALVGPEALQATWVGAAAHRAGLRPRWGRGSPEAAALAGRFGPLLAGEAGVAFNFFVDRVFAARLPVGSVTALEYADRLRVIPETLFVQGALVVLLAGWAGDAAAGRTEDVRDSCRRAAVWTVALAAPLAAALLVLRVPLTDLVYGRGQMDPAGLALTAATLGAFAPGLVPQALGVLYARVLAARGRARVLMVQGVASAGVNTALDAALVGPLGLPGLAWATTINMLIIPAALYAAVRVDLGDPLDRGAGWMVLGTVAGTAAAAAGVSAVLASMPAGVAWPLATGAVGFGAAAGAAVLGAAAWERRAGRRRAGAAPS